MSKIRAFGLFWYDFVVGDDWRVAAAVAIALAATYGVTRATNVAAWWIVPVALVILLPVSLWRATRRR